MNAAVPRNRPGLPALAYRAGTYGTFMQAMTERLRTLLPALTTRELDDPSIALLDGWALIADVLTFYQERIANEGYLRTATEQRSMIEFANLAGYRPRPGVASSVYLAYTLDKGGAVTLAPANKAQSIPGPGETAQTYETADALDARDVWNALGLRTTRPQAPSGTEPFYLGTITTNLKPNDLLLFVRANAGESDTPQYRFVRVSAVEAQAAQNRTKIVLQGDGLVWDKAPPAAGDAAAGGDASASSAASGATGVPWDTGSLIDRIGAAQSPLLRRASVPPRTPQRLVRTPAETYGADLDIAPQLFTALHRDAANVYAAVAGVPQTPGTSLAVYAFRVHAAPYGHNAPSPPVQQQRGRPTPEARIADLTPEERVLELFRALIPASSEEGAAGPDWPLALGDRDPHVLSLDARYDRIAPGSYVGVRTFPNDEPVLFTVQDTRERSRRDYGLSATTTVLTLSDAYVPAPGESAALGPLRDLDVFAQSEPLALVDVPIADDIPDDPDAAATVLELDGVYDHLAAGRWAIVSGTRTDLPGVPGAELVMIAATEHRANPAIVNDAVHTFVTLSTKLAYTYARDSVTVYGNVVRATQGETRTETIGSGDASQSRQQFTLKAKPLTFVSSPTQSGTQSTLSVRVNGVTWTQSDDPNVLGPTERAYTTATTDTGTTVIFGDGVHGARVPSGTENVVATYRSGMGTSGNVGAGKITLLLSRPLGVKAVANPISASGGADSESAGEIRRNVATALLALDRLVSLADYSNFARTFAGIAKAAVARVGSGTSGTVVLTLAGPGNAPIDPNGDLAANLGAALSALGDPRQAVALATCDRVILLVGASVDIAPDALWETVEPAIRAALNAAFGFGARDFGQPAYRSEAIAAIQGVAGVVNVSVDLFAGITAATLSSLPELAQSPVANETVVPLPARGDGTTVTGAQLVTLESAVRDTIVLRNAGGGVAL
jgi:hypothetical protein